MIGIYRITNRETDKSYVGLSIFIDERINNHNAALRSGTHKNMELQKDWNKYGEDNFYFDVIDVIDSDDYSRANLNKLETEYIKYFNENSYNIAKNNNKKKEKHKKKKKSVSANAVEKRYGIVFNEESYRGEFNLREAERNLIIKAAVKYRFNRKEIAEVIGFSERTLYRRIHQHKLNGII